MELLHVVLALHGPFIEPEAAGLLERTWGSEVLIHTSAVPYKVLRTVRYCTDTSGSGHFAHVCHLIFT
jgi:hypothetical protein